MTGLNLETFLHLLRADVGAWATLGLIVGLLGLMTWTSWGSRRALRKCLVLSIAAHAGLVVYGGSNPSLFLAGGTALTEPQEPRLRSIRVATLRDDGTVGPDARNPADEAAINGLSGWEQPAESAATDAPELDPTLRADRPDEATAVAVREVPGEPLRPESATPDVALPDSGPIAARAIAAEPTADPSPIAPDAADVEIAAPARAADADRSTVEGPALIVPEFAVGRPPRSVPGGRATPEPIRPEIDLRRGLRPAPSDTRVPLPSPSALALADRDPRGAVDGMAPMAERRGLGLGRTLDDVAPVYRSRLDPNRAARARRAGATDASEQAVERALAWLAAHQDADGRWDAGTARYNDGAPAPGDESFTKHCPPGDLCRGECYYWEADTAVTGLALLTFLGAGYTHVDGKHAGTVDKGLGFLLKAQKADGDLRGRSKAVGMYCHAMATLALSEGLALTGDPRLRIPVERAIGFLVAAQYPSQMGWRYAPADEITRKAAANRRDWDYSPHPPVGDTSVLGWVVLALKSAAVVEVDVPESAPRAALKWLEKVADGPRRGLARYQPSRPPDPTMTAEAWLCRQFLGVGGDGPASDEAAAYLLTNAPRADAFNAYYWYYGTLAMYQRGGDDWAEWNALVRDQLIARQKLSGHMAGSWDPDPTRYGTHGGRLYSTALAALSLEVYYRYLRLYDQPTTVPVPPAIEDDRTAILRPPTGG